MTIPPYVTEDWVRAKCRDLRRALQFDTKVKDADCREETAGSGTTVVQALAAVADHVRAVRKSERNEHGNYNFRGIDAVMNAVGPALRAHGVVCLPTTVEFLQSTVQTTSGKPQTSSRVLVRYTFHGPAGDSVSAEVWGESWDSSDKGLSQAYSVAYRTCLLQTLTIPTDDPDPDHNHEQLALAIKDADCRECRRRRNRELLSADRLKELTQ